MELLSYFGCSACARKRSINKQHHPVQCNGALVAFVDLNTLVGCWTTCPNTICTFWVFIMFIICHNLFNIINSWLHAYHSRYMPPAVATLGIHELDDQMVGKFSFHCREAVLKILSTSGGMENLQVSLMAEVCQCTEWLVDKCCNCLCLECPQECFTDRLPAELTTFTRPDGYRLV